ncbi:NAD(P)/FAD-dependent oxidoreductase [Solirhodobacter olei]|uniref:NAD(P)/FAD-dependent oxidoreductase n=1 Tax=Solirhodobacter olei TaxID=2493082 RepID=UPI0013E312AC|nr:FAD-dependent oxidoreductase [Solirhodobacter olei]
MHRLYEDAAYDTSAWPTSHWRASLPAPPPAEPLHGLVKTDVAVIGAGYAGLNAALELAQRHGASVTVLEAGQPGWGASGRNGGFCCLGGAHLSHGKIVSRVGAGGARDFRDFQHRAIEHVADLLQEYSIDARQGPEGEVCIAHSPRALAGLKAEAAAVRTLYGEEAEILPGAELAERGLSGEGFCGALMTPVGFPIHPLAYAEGLARAAERAGAQVFGGSPVTGLVPEGEGWRLTTPGGVLLARRVLIATNGYSSEDLPPWIGGRTLPAQSAVLVTRPLSAAEKRAQGFTTPLMSYDSRNLLHYFRHLPDGRFLFGMRGGASAAPEAQRRNARRVHEEFARIFPAWAEIEATSEWFGFVCLTGSLAPYVGPVPGAPGLFATFGWHGNGVAPASLGGRLAGQLISGMPTAVPALMRQVPKRFPLPPLRRVWLRMGYVSRALRDGPLPPAKRV